jgi:hypothetical protein
MASLIHNYIMNKICGANSRLMYREEMNNDYSPSRIFIENARKPVR